MKDNLIQLLNTQTSCAIAAKREYKGGSDAIETRGCFTEVQVKDRRNVNVMVEGPMYGVALSESCQQPTSDGDK